MNNRKQIFTGLFLLLALVAYGAWQWSVLSANQITIQSAETQATNLRGIQQALLNNHEQTKLDVLSARRDREQNLSQVFPTSENVTDLTRLLDDFASRNHFAENPFFISSLSYGSPISFDEDHYQVVPINLNLQTSRKNLDRFIDFVDQSGSLASGVRLLSIQNIQMSYPSQPSEPFNVQMVLHAYFSRPL